MDPQDGRDGKNRRISHRRAGTEPVTARSALGLRAGMSAVALLAAVVAGVVFALRAMGGAGPGAAPWVITGICAAVAVIAAIDLAVIYRRSKEP
ncbi:DUF6343 family protein [Actinocorallia sp. API 0066]|uniref:DUF6343 family protein n=1 Tax=Actinocorallia sp. API 0066 TaxID=2896846 RepID=UPI001E5D3984|nr:DUF6343 family protein [Actinocorallia sp. API 0066]MCD0451704.1 DUF6343 family protein [Actinocorallia sp. API 0066]